MILACVMALLGSSLGFAQEAGKPAFLSAFSLAIRDAEPETLVPAPRPSRPLPGGVLFQKSSVEPSSPAQARMSIGGFALDWLRDAGEIWTYPLHVKSRDILPLSVLAVTAAILIPSDEGLNSLMTTHVVDHDGDDAFSPVLSEMGSYGAWGTAGAFLAFGLLARDSKATETAALAASAMLQSALVVQVGKMVTGRLRPFARNGIDGWGGPVGYFQQGSVGQRMSSDSFPSGHTATAFSLATVIAMQYGEHPWVPIVAYTVAAGVGFSRLSGNNHWLSDVVVGAVLGHVIARMVVKNYWARHRIQPTLALGPHGFSIGASYDFH